MAANPFSESVWLPDLVAAWYDELSPVSGTVLLRPHRDVLRLARAADAKLLTRPHRAGFDLNNWIDDAATSMQRYDRLHASLAAVSRAMEDVGITRYLGGGEQWNAIRDRFMKTGNLLDRAAGFLLPGAEEEFAWRVRPPVKSYDMRFAFPGFVRAVPQKFEVAVTYLPDVEIPIESIRRELKIAVVPLVGDIGEFDWTPVDGDPPRFRVSLKHPEETAAQAETAIATAGRNGCDIVVFPELCFEHEKQKTFGRAIARATHANGGRPWLVVAGSAYSPALPFESEHHNRAIVFDASGRELLQHNKLHPYEFSMEEQERYGIAPILGATARTEDIITIPPRVTILQSPIGRVAVLICEDIWNLGTFLPMLQDLAVDWLFVPVLDGIQHKNRWTGFNAGQYAEHGTSVVVATSASLVEAHRLFLSRKTPVDPMAATSFVGLLATPHTDQRRIREFRMPAQHYEPSILKLETPPE